MVAKGETAPDFEAPDQDGAPFRLASLRGTPVVLYFYPKADTPGCTIEAKGFRDVYDAYRAKHVAVVGVSTDDCPAQKKFAGKHRLPFPLVADAQQTVAGLYGVLGPSGHARRVTFLLDAQGKVLEVVEGSPEEHLKRAAATFLA